MLSRRGSTSKLSFGPMTPGIDAAKLVRGELQLGVGLREVYAGLESGGDEKVVALVGAVGVDLEGQPDVGFGIGDEGFSQDAEDGIRLIAERKGFADDVRIAAETALPQAIAEDDDIAAVGRILLGVKVRPRMMGAPKRRKYASQTWMPWTCSGWSPVRLKPGPPKS